MHVITVMIGEFFLVLLDLAVKSIGQRIDGGVHVGGLGVGVDGLVGGAMQRGFGLVQELFHAQGNGDVVQMLEMADYAVEFPGNVIVQGGGDGNLVTADIDLHGVFLVMN
jgi:hypothetical protein